MNMATSAYQFLVRTVLMRMYIRKTVPTIAQLRDVSGALVVKGSNAKMK